MKKWSLSEFKIWTWIQPTLSKINPGHVESFVQVQNHGLDTRQSSLANLFAAKVKVWESIMRQRDSNHALARLPIICDQPWVIAGYVLWSAKQFSFQSARGKICDSWNNLIYLASWVFFFSFPRKWRKCYKTLAPFLLRRHFDHFEEKGREIGRN